MGVFDRWFKGRGSGAQNGTALEQFLDGITPAYMVETQKTLAPDMKVPVAQAMSVLLFSRSFTRTLSALSQELAEPFKTTWPFPHDRIFTEVVAFYFFVLLREYLGQPRDDDDYDLDWDEDETDEEAGDNRLQDPYAASLVSAMDLAGKLIHALSDTGLVEQFVQNRAMAYSSRVHRDGVMERLERFLFEAWNPDKTGAICLDPFAPHGSIMAVIKVMPIEAVEASCKGLYDEYARNPWG